MKIEYSVTYDDAYKMFQCLRNERFLVWFLNDGFQLAIVFFLWTMFLSYIWHLTVLLLAYPATDIEFSIGVMCFVFIVLIWLTWKYFDNKNGKKDTTLKQKFVKKQSKNQTFLEPRTVQIVDQTLILDTPVARYEIEGHELRCFDFEDIIAITHKRKWFFTVIPKRVMTPEQRQMIMNFAIDHTKK
ncbi:MAG: hypothetical protein ACRDAO_07940 [Culicoidibacterales bacterium]